MTLNIQHPDRTHQWSHWTVTFIF